MGHSEKRGATDTPTQSNNNTGATAAPFGGFGTPATTATSAPARGVPAGIFGGRPATGFTLGVQNTGLGQNPLGLPAPTAQTTTNEGLGGIDFSSLSGDKTGNLPPLICQDVDNFQKFVKEQKQAQKEICWMSSKAMIEVEEDIKAVEQLLSVVSSVLQRNTLAIKKLKIETAQEHRNAEIALKTPPGCQPENTAPADYFWTLVEQFEVQLQLYWQKFEELENHLATEANGFHITPQDLSMAMQTLYQTFIALAAQLQTIHENVKMYKDQYLCYRKKYLGDSTDVFEARRAEAKKCQSPPHITTGPSPFSIPDAGDVAMAATLTQQQQLLQS